MVEKEDCLGRRHGWQLDSGTFLGFRGRCIRSVKKWTCKRQLVIFLNIFLCIFLNQLFALKINLSSIVFHNTQLFNLWGSFDNFNYAKHDHIHCAARPAKIGDWTGFWAGSRGLYCPRVGNNQLKKHTWHSTGWITSDMGWEPAAKVCAIE